MWGMPPATRASWKTKPPPRRRGHFELPMFFSDVDGEQMRHGHVPKNMDDKWFICFEEGWLYFYRSWTGDCIYGVRLDGSPAGVRVIDAWASRDFGQRDSFGLEADIETVRRLIESRLLA